ncbi:MAG: hypothetical protein H6577_27170 [Lewinellaceae bacterium]|nr:hypothetical protein [Saprospiraceae bacterium]MCB9341825.1 hypothetical protein [Lewinellaceae bacterium]
MTILQRKKLRRKSPLNQLKLVRRKRKFKVMYRQMQETAFSKKNRKATSTPPGPSVG